MLTKFFFHKRWWLKLPALFMVSVLLIKITWIALFAVDGRALINNEERRDLLDRRAYLIQKLYREPAGPDQMPDYLPQLFRGEWALISHLMTTMALTNLAQTYPETKAESREVVAALIERVLTPEMRAFDVAMWGEDPLETLGQGNGHVGYLGELNLMLAAYHSLGGQNAEYQALFEAISSHLQHTMLASPSLNGETYPGEIYIPDNAVAVASLALFDQLNPGQAGGFAGQWVKHMRAYHLDEETGLLPFSLYSDGRPLLGSRGSGAAWSSFFLYYADPAFANEQYDRLVEHFAKRPFPGIAAICEWPGCREGWGDVDSGPLVAGLSPSGTAFAIAGAKFSAREALLDGLLRGGETAGFTLPGPGGRHYLIAPLVGDAILLAMMSVTKWG